MRLVFTCVLGARLLLQSYEYPNLSEGADRVGGQLRGDRECPFSGATKSGRVWRKMPECAWNSEEDDETVKRRDVSARRGFPGEPFHCHLLSD